MKIIYIIFISNEDIYSIYDIIAFRPYEVLKNISTELESVPQDQVMNVETSRITKEKCRPVQSMN